MDKQLWFELPKKERAERLKALLKQIIEIDTLETEKCKTEAVKPHNDKYNLEQQVLKIMRWEKEENEED